MTPQEAIELIKWTPLMRCDDGCVLAQSLDMAIKALEKQIPKKPIDVELTVYSGGTRIVHASCSICGQPIRIFDGHQNNKEFRRDEDVFCSHCGQHIDWSE